MALYPGAALTPSTSLTPDTPDTPSATASVAIEVAVTADATVSGGATATVTLAPTITATATTETPTLPGASTDPVTAAVQIEFTDGVWTDVTAYWDAKRPVQITGGRSDVDERVQPGRLSGLWLDNTDGRFTVGNSSGAYWPNVAAGKRVRFSVKDPASSTYYARFTGRIDGWPLSWADNATTCWVQVSATDALADWAKPVPPFMAYQAREIDAGDSTCSMGAYFECVALDDAGRLASTDGAYALANEGLGATEFRTAGPLGDPRNVLEFPVSTDTTTTYKGVAPFGSSTSWGVSAWIRVAQVPPAGTTYAPILVEDTATGYGVALMVTDAGALEAWTFDAGVGTYRTGVSVNVSDGAWHNVAIVGEGNGALSRLWIGARGGWGAAASGLPAATVLGNTNPKTLRLGRIGGSVCHVSTWSVTSPYKPNIQSLYMSGWGLSAYTDASGRLAQVADMLGTTNYTYSGVRTGVANSSPVGTGLDLARVVEDTDGGVLWASRSGLVTYTGGAERTSPSGGISLRLAAEEIGPDVQVLADSLDICNHVTLTNRRVYNNAEMSNVVVAQDADSITRYGRRTRELTTSWADFTTSEPQYLNRRAGELLVAAEAPRIPVLTLDVMAMTDAQQLAVLGLDMWDQVGVTGLPTAGGFDSSRLFRVEGWTETVGVDVWQVALNVSNAGNSLGDATHGLILGSNRLG